MSAFQDNSFSIANTPLVQIQRIGGPPKGRLLAKIEGRNPGYSVKCRIGAGMVWDAEEKGLFGSKHFARRPVVPVEWIKALVNLDMVGRLRKDQLTVYGSRTGYGWRRLVSLQNDASQLAIDFTWNIKTTADHYPFFQRNVPVILMHMLGTPRTMQDNPVYSNVTAEVGSYLEDRIDFAVRHGVKRNRIVIDPGIGFGKTLDHNLELLRNLPGLVDRCGPILVGASRKSFIGQITGRTRPEERQAGSLGVAAWAVAHGAHILRVHDVLDTCDVCRMLDRFICGEPQCNG